MLVGVPRWSLTPIARERADWLLVLAWDEEQVSRHERPRRGAASRVLRLDLRPVHCVPTIASAHLSQSCHCFLFLLGSHPRPASGNPMILEDVEAVKSRSPLPVFQNIWLRPASPVALHSVIYATLLFLSPHS